MPLKKEKKNEQLHLSPKMYISDTTGHVVVWWERKAKEIWLLAVFFWVEDIFWGFNCSVQKWSKTETKLDGEGKYYISI